MNVPHSLILEQKENTKHGEVFFPIQKYITKLNLNSPVIMTHWHEEAELTLITKGSCIYQIDLVEYEVNEGDLLFIPPLLLHSIRLNGTDNFCSETYVFHVNFLGGNATDICSTRYLTPMINHELTLPYHISSTHPAHHSLHECFIKMASLYTEQTFGYEIALKSVLLQALFLLLQYSTTESATISASSDKLKNVLDYIDLHYAEPLTISELAELCYFSEYHFMRFFKKYMGESAMEYVRNVRLAKAAELFEQGAQSSLEVSLSCGFNNLSYFHREFKEKYGMTPGAFQRKINV